MRERVFTERQKAVFAKDWSLAPAGDEIEEALDIEHGNLGAIGTWTCVFDYDDGDEHWTCEGIVEGKEHVYNPAPLAICRALLDYNREGELQ